MGIFFHINKHIRQAFYLQFTIKIFQMYFLMSVTEVIVHDDL